MSAQRPEAVVFDIGEVLVQWNPEGFYDRSIGAPARRALFGTVDLHAMNARIDLGAPLHETVEAEARRHPRYADHIRMWASHWLEMASPDIPASARLLRSLRGRGVPVFALSNFGRETFEIARRAYPVLAEFDAAFVSGHLHIVKPDPAIYERLEADTGVAPERLFFTDDRPENVAAARARGWQAHLFERPEGLARCLVEAGLLAPGEAAP